LLRFPCLGHGIIYHRAGYSGGWGNVVREISDFGISISDFFSVHS